MILEYSIDVNLSIPWEAPSIETFYSDSIEDLLESIENFLKEYDITCFKCGEIKSTFIEN